MLRAFQRTSNVMVTSKSALRERLRKNQQIPKIWAISLSQRVAVNRKGIVRGELKEQSNFRRAFVPLDKRCKSAKWSAGAPGDGREVARQAPADVKLFPGPARKGVCLLSEFLTNVVLFANQIWEERWGHLRLRHCGPSALRPARTAGKNWNKRLAEEQQDQSRKEHLAS